MKREEVYRAIDSERDYQNEKWSEFSDENNNWADWLLYIEHHLNKAKESVYDSHNTSFLHEIRKIAALAVACGEQNNMPSR